MALVGQNYNHIGTRTHIHIIHLYLLCICPHVRATHASSIGNKSYSVSFRPFLLLISLARQELACYLFVLCILHCHAKRSHLRICFNDEVQRRNVALLLSAFIALNMHTLKGREREDEKNNEKLITRKREREKKQISINRDRGNSENVYISCASL